MKKKAKTPAMNKLTTASQTITYRSNPKIQTTQVDDLESRLRELLETSLEAVDVIFKVKDFKEVLSTIAKDRGTIHSVEIANGQGRVRIDSTGVLPMLKIKDGPGPITFRMKIIDNKTGELYYPIGIAFKSLCPNCPPNQNPGDIIGSDEFPTRKMHIYGGNLYMTASMVHQKAPSYKFSVIIQRTDGKIGIIDPGIEDDNIT